MEENYNQCVFGSAYWYGEVSLEWLCACKFANFFNSQKATLHKESWKHNRSSL